ncbi:MAG: saccharopine dehydrogenase NADP-binding domain-containing protein [Myxococcales bacterium]|nr:saccharopine dehydrogenase NADP-binding domain-containing protein [Myxococcales bacterium]
MQPVLVLGATGYTGRLVVEALERQGRPFVIAGRSREKLEALAARCKHRPEVRVADPTQPETLRDLFRGVRAVVNTVGPFRKFGVPVVEAAIAQRVHYVDTTGEQAYQKDVLDRFGETAREAGVTVITAQAFEYAFGYCAVTILNKLHGPIGRFDTYHRAAGPSGFGVSHGTAKSGLGMLNEPFLMLENGRLVRQPTRWRPTSVRFPGEAEELHATAIPGGDVVLLAREISNLQHGTCNLVWPARTARMTAITTALLPLVRLFLRPWLIKRIEGWIDRRLTPPTEAERKSVKWTVVSRATGLNGTFTVRVDGTDPYGITGEVAALGAGWLADGKAKSAGVVSTGRAFDPVAFLDALKDQGVTWFIEK